MTPIVDDPSELTPQWVTASLASQGHAVKVESVSHERVGTGQVGASYRLHLQYAEGGRDLPSTLVAKIASGSAESRQRVGEGYRREVRFYADLAPLVDVKTPTCWYAAIRDDAQAFTLLLEDLSPRVAGRQVDGCSPEQAAEAVTNLAGLHAPLWCSSLLDRHADWLRPMDAATAAFIGDLMVSGTDQFVDRYRDRLGSENVSTLRSAARLVGGWLTTGHDVFALIHGDYRLDNLMFPQAGLGVATVDWQTATIGPPIRDLAYFLSTSLPPELRRRHERELVMTYLEALASRGVAHPKERAFKDYRLGMLQGPMITVLGCIFATADPSPAADEMFLAMATRSCAAIRELDSLAVARAAVS